MKQKKDHRKKCGECRWFGTYECPKSENVCDATVIEEIRCSKEIGL